MSDQLRRIGGTPFNCEQCGKPTSQEGKCFACRQLPKKEPSEPNTVPGQMALVPSPAAEELLKDRERLIGVVKLAYLKHHCGKDNIGWEALSERMCDELCNAMGDKEFQLWLSEENQDV